MSEDNFPWQVVNRYNNREEALESIKEHRLGYLVEKSSVIGISLGVAALAGSALLKWLAPEIEEIPKLYDSLIVGSSLLTLAGFAGFTSIGRYMHSNPNNYTHLDYHRAAETFLKTGINRH